MMILHGPFYEKQCITENWSVRELKRQINSSLFERIALSKDKKGVLKLAEKGSIIEKPKDFVKDPYVFEFLNLPERDRYSEKDLENQLVEKLGHFLLELGKGFAFIGQQYRITLNNTHYYNVMGVGIDLSKIEVKKIAQKALSLFLSLPVGSISGPRCWLRSP